jgi:predicted MFS family arabinose efflux permease
MFHSGIFSWLGLYFVQRYGLTDPQIGLALLGYGLPGLLLGPLIGRLADRIGRRWVIPTGLLVSAFAGAALIPHWPLLWPCVVATVLSLGFDMSHPLLTGIITSVDADRRGQALGLNAFVLFSGFGLGSLVFQGLLMHRGFGFALTSFAIAEVGLAIAGFVAFRHEVAERAHEHH